jgi:hypothetical protein
VEHGAGIRIEFVCHETDLPAITVALYATPPYGALEQINLMMPLYFYRHCEERSDMAIHAVIQLPEALKQAERPAGLPHRFVPRNDECHTLCAFV